MKTLTLAFAFIAVFSFSQLYSQTKNYSSADNEITAAKYEQFTVTLASNKTTGYSWSVGMIADNSQVVVTGVEYKVPENAQVGQGGDEVWHFKAVGSGTVKIMFYYARPWENTKPVQEKTYTVTVN